MVFIKSGKPQTLNNVFKPFRLASFMAFLVGFVFVSDQFGGLRPLREEIGLRQLNTEPLVQRETEREPRLGDGCYHVFLDAGANIGIHSRFLFEAEKYSEAKNAQIAFAQAFGPAEKRDNRDFCAFGFEPNPAHRARHKELEKAYADMGWRYIPINVGLSDEDGTMDFYRDDREVNKGDWGFSVVDRVGNSEKEVVPVIHFAKWIEHHILERRVPSKVYGNYDEQENQSGDGLGSVVLKMDIEGMEFIVAPSLMFSGVLCKGVDIVFGEWHDAGHIPQREAMDIHGRGKLAKFDDWIKAKQHFMALWKGLQTVNPHDCRARWLELFDDEQYLHDGIPFPTPK